MQQTTPLLMSSQGDNLKEINIQGNVVGFLCQKCGSCGTEGAEQRRRRLRGKKQQVMLNDGQEKDLEKNYGFSR